MEGQELSGGQTGGMYIPAEDIQDYLDFQATKRQRRITQFKKDHDKIFEQRRTTLVLRRTTKEHNTIAPDEDVIAYIALYQMRDAVTADNKKVVVTDDEVKAFLILNPDFTNTPSLEEVEAKASEIKAANGTSETGTATNDNPSDDVENQ